MGTVRPPQGLRPTCHAFRVDKGALLHLAITALDVLHSGSERRRRHSGLIALSDSCSSVTAERLHFATPRRRRSLRCNSAGRCVDALGPFAVADVAEHTGADETVQAVGEHVARDPKTLEELIQAMASDPYVAFAPPSGKC